MPRVVPSVNKKQEHLDASLPCSVSSTMDEFSVVDELSLILSFLNPFLAKLPEEAREGLCRRMSLETINRDRTIYKQGDEVPNFYLILSGMQSCALSESSP